MVVRDGVIVDMDWAPIQSQRNHPIDDVWVLPTNFANVTSTRGVPCVPASRNR